MSVPAKAKSRRDTTAMALLMAMGLAAAITGGAGLSAFGSGALQETLRLVGIGRDGAIVQEQQRQARSIADLQRTIASMRGDFAELNSRVIVGDDLTLQQHVSRLEAEVGSLKSDVVELRTDSGDDPGSELWHQQAQGVTDALKKARADMGALRLSFDGREDADRKAFANINRRLSRLESTLASAEVTGSIRHRRRPHRVVVARP